MNIIPGAWRKLRATSFCLGINLRNTGKINENVLNLRLNCFSHLYGPSVLSFSLYFPSSLSSPLSLISLFLSLSAHVFLLTALTPFSVSRPARMCVFDSSLKSVPSLRDIARLLSIQTAENAFP